MRTKLLATGLAIVFATVGTPVASADTPGHIGRAVPHARAEKAEYNVPASVSIAQSILESKAGTSKQAVQDNNFHGLKCAAPNRPGPIAKGCRAYKTQECRPTCRPVTAHFRVFGSMRDSFRDHGRLLTQNPAYRKALQYRTDPDRFIRAIAKTYATDPKYADKVIKLMRDHDLYRFDRVA